MILDSAEETHLQQEVTMRVEKTFVEMHLSGGLKGNSAVHKLRSSVDELIRNYRPLTFPNFPQAHTARAVRADLLQRMALLDSSSRLYAVLDDMRDRIKGSYLPRGNICPLYIEVDAPAESVGRGLPCLDCGETSCYKGRRVTAGFDVVDK